MAPPWRWALPAQDFPLPGPLEGRGNLVLYVVTAGVVLSLLALLTRRRKRGRDPERGLAENLAGYPPPPGPPRRRLTVRGQPARLRLVVVAPAGKKVLADVASLLGEVVRGLREVAREDRPRVRVWPPQLSAAGFPPMFFRLTPRPEAPGKPSHWVRVAGQARVGGQPVLLGLALWAEQPTQLDQLTLQPSEWAEALRVRHA